MHVRHVMTEAPQRKAVKLLVATLLALSAQPSFAQTPDPGPVNAEPDTAYVTYDDGPISLPFGIGLRIPAYNRVDGLALPWGPDIKLGDKIRLAPTITYRTHIGELDPYITGLVALARTDTLRFAGGRSTFSNDAWIRSDLINSLAAIGVGTDARNYFRADRGAVELFHSIVQPTMTITPSIGFLHEFAWSTGVPFRHSSAAWSVFGQTDSLKMRRINPAIARGHTTSGLGGIRIDYDDRVTIGRLAARVEHAFDAPPWPAGASQSEDGDFTQFTLDARAKFPTFGLQYFQFRGHGVFTGGDAPPQRFAYLGGGGTLSTVDLLAFGGDRLVYVEGEYFYPLRGPILPFVGAPVISLRYAAGSAGIDELPDFVQNIGIAVGLKVIKAEYHVDPSYEENAFSKRSAFSLGFSLSL